MGHTGDGLGWRGKRLDDASGTTKTNENVIRSLLEVEKKVEPNRTKPATKPRYLPSLELDLPEAGKKPTLKIKAYCKTIVDWINGRTKMKTRESTVPNTQNLLRDWWGRGVHLRQRTAEWGHTHLV